MTSGTHLSVPASLLLLLPQFGKDERYDQHADEDGHHAQGQRQTQLPVHRVLAGLSAVAELAVAHQTGSAARRDHTGAAAIALNLPTGGQVVVDASRFRRGERGGHCGGGRGGQERREEAAP